MASTLAIQAGDHISLVLFLFAHPHFGTKREIADIRYGRSGQRQAEMAIADRIACVLDLVL